MDQIVEEKDGKVLGTPRRQVSTANTLLLRAAPADTTMDDSHNGDGHAGDADGGRDVYVALDYANTGIRGGTTREC